MQRTGTGKTILTALLGAPLLAACTTAAPMRADATRAPPPPDYATPAAWLAFPGRNGLERSAPPTTPAVQERFAQADVFFIHPTTLKGSAVQNAAWDVPDDDAPLMAPVLLGQASVFNACCRIYAPRYRQASLKGLDNDAAVGLAYSDVAQAFRHFLANESRGRPFIIASHSQGTSHAIRLLQEEVLNKPVRTRLVAAYLIGGYVPANFGEVGLPVCDSADQTGCVLSYNASQGNRKGARMLIDDKTYWWRGTLRKEDQAPAVCVNPLSWRREGAAAASANPGSQPFPQAPFPRAAQALAAPIPQLTGAECRDGLLRVDIPRDAPTGFRNGLSLLTGSYHLNDYGIFDESLRRNAVQRVTAWRQRSQAAGR